MTQNETGHLPLCPNCHSSMNRMLMDRPGHEGTWYYDMDLFACPDCEPRQVAFKLMKAPGVIFFEQAPHRPSKSESAVWRMLGE